ncbi:MAG: hypothetical protein EOP45_00490 [Sphingobacteriaceae bacterium]|nr:MAG: hypothetical protein EOP45_00490 [Sphingobacteriaceae bacterium]
MMTFYNFINTVVVLFHFSNFEIMGSTTYSTLFFSVFDVQAIGAVCLDDLYVNPILCSTSLG